MKIVNLITKETVRCHIEKASLKKLSVCKDNFRFDWSTEFQHSEIYFLATYENPQIIQGLIGIRDQNGFLLLTLIERAGYGKEQVKLYERVAQLLIAFACRLSVEKGMDGYIAFDAKSVLVDYYNEITGAIRIGNSNRMIILPEQAQKLITLLYED